MLSPPSPSPSSAIIIIDDPTSILVPLCMFGLVFLVNMYRTRCLVKSCEYTSMFHHSISIVAAIACMVAEWGSLSTRAVYG